MNSVARLRVLRSLLQQLSRTPAAATVVRSSSSSLQLSDADRDKFYPKLGNRDVVGYGQNGNYLYADMEEFPCPAIRFKPNTPEILALRVKEKGDWSKLSIDEKKELYRASFAQTFAELKAPSGDWKSILTIFFAGLSLTGWILIYIHKYVYPPVPHTITPEWQERQLERMVKQRQGAVEGVSSQWDYEKNQWK